MWLEVLGLGSSHFTLNILPKIASLGIGYPAGDYEDVIIGTAAGTLIAKGIAKIIH